MRQGKLGKRDKELEAGEQTRPRRNAAHLGCIRDEGTSTIMT